MNNQLEMLSQREQLMEDIENIIESNFGEVEYKDDYIPKESPLSKENIIDTYKPIKYKQDLEWLKLKREYNKKWSGYRTHFNL